MILLIPLRTANVLKQCHGLNLQLRKLFHSLYNKSFKSKSQSTNSRSFFSFIRKSSPRQLKEADNVPDHFELIYRNKMSHYLLGAQLVSLVCGGIVVLGIMFKTSRLDSNRNTVEWSSTAVPVKNEDIYYITCFSLFLVFVQVLVGRTPIRIYKVPQKPKYVAINYGNYFFGKQTYSFLRGEMSRSDPTGILPWKENRYVISTKTERKSVILVDYFFRRPADLSIMIGEQKDPDLEEEEKDNK